MQRVHIRAERYYLKIGKELRREMYANGLPSAKFQIAQWRF